MESVRARLTSGTGAVIPLHYGGRPCDLDELYETAGEAGATIVEDCAHAAGAAYKGRRIGSHGSFHAFSFNAVKNLPAPGGGALTLGSDEHEARLRRLRVLGLRLLREVEPDRTSSNHLFCVLAEERDSLVERLREAGVDSSVHYRPNDTYELFEEQTSPAPSASRAE